MMFTDSLGENVELLNELLRGMPPGAQKRAHDTAVQIERVISGLRHNHPKDPAVALGTAWCIFQIAQQMSLHSSPKAKPD